MCIAVCHHVLLPLQRTKLRVYHSSLLFELWKDLVESSRNELKTRVTNVNDKKKDLS